MSTAEIISTLTFVSMSGIFFGTVFAVLMNWITPK